jgi:alpha-D-ribose 1-methylphosphonate 5-phosphate C-P lyase
MKKLLLKLAIFSTLGTFAIAEVNYRECVRQAQKVETDGEIQHVLNEYGYQVGLYDEITFATKLSAAYHVLTN